MECHGAVTVSAAPPYNFGLETVVLQLSGGVKLNPVSQMIERMEQAVEIMAE